MDTPDALVSAAAGMHAQAQRLDVIAENLANASTVGYRPKFEIGAAEGAASDSQGPLRRTDVPTDLALVGPGLFAVVARDGVRYTRDGRMLVDASGHLCDARGNKVLGALGPAHFPRGARVESDGRIVFNGRTIDRLRIVDLTAGHAAVRPGTQVRSGYLEDSGVDPIAEMTALVTAERAYEANQKSAQRADETLRRAVTDVPAVRQ